MKIFKKIIQFLANIGKTKQVEEAQKPYVFYIDNKSDKEQTAILFGVREFMDKENFGSDAGIEIKPAFDGNYKDNLEENSINPIPIDKIIKFS